MIDLDKKYEGTAKLDPDSYTKHPNHKLNYHLIIVTFRSFEPYTFVFQI